MNEHSGYGVVPGRYAGKPIPIHSGPTPEQAEYAEAKSAADGLAGKIAAAASLSAQASAVLLELVGEFDATGAVRFWTEVKSVALGDLRPGEALGVSSLRCGPRRNSSRGMPYASSVPLDVQAPRPAARLAVQEGNPLARFTCPRPPPPLLPASPIGQGRLLLIKRQRLQTQYTSCLSSSHLLCHWCLPTRQSSRPVPMLSTFSQMRSGSSGGCLRAACVGSSTLRCVYRDGRSPIRRPWTPVGRMGTPGVLGGNGSWCA